MLSHKTFPPLQVSQLCSSSSNNSVVEYQSTQICHIFEDQHSSRRYWDLLDLIQ